MPLFEVALIIRCTKKETEDTGEVERLILAPTPVLARNDQMAGIIAITKNAKDIDVDMSRVEVLVRPFV